jgi:glycosyltransferase involved in cell wall biosynthesis
MKRILVDCSALQGRSWDRGIGKYAECLIANLKNSEVTQYGYLISTFDEIRPLSEVVDFIKEKANTEDIHIWPFRQDVSKNVIQLEREIFIKSLSYDEVLIIDLFESRHHIPMSINQFHQIPTSIILHDLIPYENPQIYLASTSDSNVYYEAVEDLKKVNLVFCDSEYSLKSFVKNFSALAERAYFVGGGPNDNFRNLALPKKKQILSILGDDPRKNVANLLLAWSRLPADILKDHTLKIVGNFTEERIKYFCSKVLSDFDFPDSLVFTGRISDLQLEAELNYSLALCHPAISEGLGLPILEAIFLEIPAITSNNTSMVEIARNGSLIDPQDPGSIAFYLELIISDENFFNNVVQSQKEVPRIYNWKSVAEKITTLFEKENKQFNLAFKNQSELTSLVKPKIAYIAPSVSSKTGISRFAYDLLPYLQQIAEVDYLSAESLSDLEETRILLKRYDQVFVQLGNSPHHKNSFKIAANIPSIVLCHDIRFGQTLMSLNNQDREWMPELEALKTLDGDQLDIFSLLRILNLALGVIVHSDTAANFLSHVGLPAVKIKKLQFPSMFSNDSNILQAAEKEFVSEVASFGFITPNKGYEVLLEGISIYNSIHESKISLKLVGEADPMYSRILLDLAKNYQVDLMITGFLDLSSYLSELSSSCLAVQLRLADAGEASAAVSDLLSIGIPTIVNDIGSFKDLPNELAYKVSRVPSPIEIADALWELQSPKVRNGIARSAKAFSRSFASPATWAAEVIDFMDARYKLDLVNNTRKFASTISNRDLPPLLESIHLIEKTDVTFGYNFKIGSDISNLKKTSFISGIQRATLEIHKCLNKLSQENRYIYSAVDLNFESNYSELVHPQIAEDPIVSGIQNHAENCDALLLIDLNFNFFQNQSMVELQKRGTPIVVNVYDILAITNPDWFPPGTAERHFLPWLKAVCHYASDIIVNSEATLDQLRAFDLTKSFKGEIHVAPLGVPFNSPPLDLKKIPGQTLIVGTIEPRKGHADILQAFDEMESRNENISLHIVGRQGWMVEGLINQISNHPSLNKTLFWHSNCSDSKLHALYAESEVTLVPSLGEGFGLPILEAANFGSKVLARDIPVFRELESDQIHYFDSDNSNLIEMWSRLLNNAPDSVSTNLDLDRFSGYYKYAQKLTTILDTHLKMNFKSK